MPPALFRPWRVAFRYLSRLLSTLRVSLLLVCLSSVASGAGEQPEGWTLERNVAAPSYAVIEPKRTNLNIDVMALVCEQADGRTFLQLQIYLTTGDLLMPQSVPSNPLKANPRAEIVIDGRAFPVDLLFADEYAVLADGDRTYPQLSDKLLDAIETGSVLVLRFDLAAEQAGQPVDFDGEAVIDLQSGLGGRAVATVRRCAGQKFGPQSIVSTAPS